jgi:hypothetical protein
MKFVCGLLYSMSCCLIVSLLSALCLLLSVKFKLIVFLCFNFSFYVCFLVLYVLLSILYVLCFCIVLCIVSPHIYSCLLSICVQFYWPLPLGRNQTAVNKYHITLSKFSNHCFSLNMFTVCFHSSYKIDLKECGFRQSPLYSRYYPGTAKSDWENHKILQSGSYQGPPKKQAC